MLWRNLFLSGPLLSFAKSKNPSEPLLEFASDTSPISFPLYLTISDMPWLRIIISKLGYDEMVYDPHFTNLMSPLVHFEFDPFWTASAAGIGHRSCFKDLLIVTDGELNVQLGRQASLQLGSCKVSNMPTWLLI